MGPTLIISIATCVLLILSILFFPKIKLFKKEFNTFWMVCLVGALFVLIFKGVSIKNLINGLFSSSAINPIKILALFFSMTFISIFLDEVGFFKYLASYFINKCKSKQITLFILIYVIVSVLTIFTSNDIVILTFTPFICYFAKNAKINPIPYLVAEFAAANTWSMFLIIGNPTNIYLATSANINFIEYLKVMLIPTFVSGSIQLGIMLLLFKKQLSKKIEIECEVVKIKDIFGLFFGLAELLICLVLLVVSSFLNISMWVICVVCALSLLIIVASANIIRHKKMKIIKRTFKRLPYNLIPFVLSMFVIVLALNQQEVTKVIASFLKEEHVIYKYGISSFFASNLMNNIPMSVLFATIPSSVNTSFYLKAIYSIIIGSNIGAFLTPIGALAGIMFTDLIAKQNVKYTFKDFIKYGFIIAIPTLLISLIFLQIVL